MIDYSNIDKLKKEWKENGFVLLKNVLPHEEVSEYLKKTQEISGLNDSDFQDVIDGEKNPHVNTNQPLVSNEEFWPLFTNKHVLNFIKEVIDPNICFGGADSMFVHRSATTLHHDTFIEYDTFTGPDFDPNLDTLCNIRAATYLVTNELIVVPGSHKKAYPDRDRTKFQEFQDIATCVELTPGDIVLFDTMLLHAGRYLTKPKYMLVWNYVSRNRHTIIGKYYSQIVTTSTVKAWTKEFINYLKESDLYWDDMWNDGKYIPYFENLWKEMPKHNSESAKNNLDTYGQHWSPYIKKLC